MTDTKKKFGFLKRTWDEMKRLAPFNHYEKWPDNKSGKHPGANHGNKFTKLRSFVTGKPSGHAPTNHERCQTSRAAKMGISLAEYKRRFCGGVTK